MLVMVVLFFLGSVDLKKMEKSSLTFPISSYDPFFIPSQNLGFEGLDHHQVVTVDKQSGGGFSSAV